MIPGESSSWWRCWGLQKSIMSAKANMHPILPLCLLILSTQLAAQALKRPPVLSHKQHLQQRLSRNAHPNTHTCVDGVAVQCGFSTGNPRVGPRRTDGLESQPMGSGHSHAVKGINVVWDPIDKQLYAAAIANPWMMVIRPENSHPSRFINGCGRHSYEPNGHRSRTSEPIWISGPTEEIRR